jgi:hypothetical protein
VASEAPAHLTLGLVQSRVTKTVHPRRRLEVA